MRAALAAAALAASSAAAAADRHWSLFSCASGGDWLSDCWASAAGLPALGTAPLAGDTAWVGGGVAVRYIQPAGAITPLAGLRLNATLTLADPIGTLIAGSAWIGTTGGASLVHDAGTARFDTLVLNTGGISEAFYRLQGGLLANGSAIVGELGAAQLEQSGGTHRVATNLTIGQSTPFAAYRLFGGTLEVGQAVLGNGLLSLRGGTLRVASGTLEIGSLEVGAASGSNVALAVDGAAGGADNTLGAIRVRQALNVGMALGATGTVVQRSGIVNVEGDAYIARFGGTGSITLDGGLFTVGGSAYLGSGGRGSFVQNGGVANFGTLVMSPTGVGEGVVTLAGGQLNVVTLLGSPGRSRLVLEGGLLGAGTAEIALGALDIAVRDGTAFALRVDRSGQDGSARLVNARQLTIGAGGSLRRTDGTLVALDVDNAGLLALGSAQSFVSLLLRDGSTLELAGLLGVEGALTLDGTLRLSGPAPAPGVPVDVLDWGMLTGRFDAIDAAAWALGPDWVLDTSRLYVDGVLSVVAVPEPATALLWLAGGAMLLARRSRH